MDCRATLTLLFFGLSLSSCSQFPLRTYHYVNLSLTWTDAQQYCRDKYTDLATFESMDDVNRLQPNPPDMYRWIGLKDDPKSWKDAMGTDSNSWRWSATGEPIKTGYWAWTDGEPDNVDANERCGMMNQQGKWIDFRCDDPWGFVCVTVTDQGEKTYTFISTEKTWTSAQAYCREHHTDLATIEDSEENTEVYNVKPSSYSAWIGLYREPWTWSDGSQSSFRYWSSYRPENYGGNQFCVHEEPNHEWNDYVCFHKYPFICHQVSKMKTVVKMKIKSVTDLTDPAASAQLLQQMEESLRKQGMTDFKLRWKSPPRRLEEEEEEEQEEPQCP